MGLFYCQQFRFDNYPLINSSKVKQSLFLKHEEVSILFQEQVHFDHNIVYGVLPVFR